MLKVVLLIVSAIIVLFGTFLAGLSTGEAKNQPAETSISEYNRVAYRDIESSEDRIVRELQITEYEPAARQWISLDNVPGADSTYDDRVLLIFFASSFTRFDTVTYEND